MDPDQSAPRRRPTTASAQPSNPTQDDRADDLAWIEEEEDDDPGMFSFLPPDVPASPPTPSSAHHLTLPISTPAPTLTPPGTTHDFSDPLSPITYSHDSDELTPAAAYALSMATAQAPRHRNAWTESPATPGADISSHSDLGLQPHVIDLTGQDFGLKEGKGASDADSTWSPSLAGESFSMRELESRSKSIEMGSSRHTATTGISLPYSAGGLEEEEDSPYPEVRASVSNLDDPEMPVLTFRAWALGLAFSCVFSGLNLFLNFRYPAPIVYPIVVLVLVHPFGKFLAFLLPTNTWRVPKFLVRRGFEETCSLNPGPWCIKEHTVVLLMANTAMSVCLSLNYSISLRIFFKSSVGVGFDILLALSSQLLGYGFAGTARRFLIWPASQIWPQDLVWCTLLNTLHAEEYEEEEESHPTVSRYRFFLYVFTAAFIYYFIPGFLFQGLSAFSFICWAAPHNPVVNQLFGVTTGLGMSSITFDWAQIAYIGSPLVVPWWASANIMAGFVLVYWIFTPIIYYANVWSTAYLPISTSGIFDRFGQPYDTSQVVNPDFTFSEAGYKAYSPIFLPAALLSVYGLSVATATAVLVHCALYNGKTMWKQMKRRSIPEEEDVHAKLMRQYPETPDSWYAILMVVTLAMSIGAIAGWDTDFPVWALLVAVLLSYIFFIPSSFIFASTSQQVTLNVLLELVGGYLLPNNIKGNMLFKMFANDCNLWGQSFLQDLKLGHYMKIPPRTTFIIQIVATSAAVLVQFGITEALVTNVPDFCTDHQSALLSCPYSSTADNAGIIWGSIGPARQFSIGKMYSPVLWWLLAGAILPIVFWRLETRYPEVKWLAFVNIPVLLTGPTFVPPANGINYSSWFLVSFVFQYWMRRRNFRWWSKYNFILSSGLDAGTAISTIVLFLTLQLPRQGTISLNWWGNTVFVNTDDYNGVPYLTPPKEGFGPTTW